MDENESKQNKLINFKNIPTMWLLSLFNYQAFFINLYLLI